MWICVRLCMLRIKTCKNVWSHRSYLESFLPPYTLGPEWPWGCGKMRQQQIFTHICANIDPMHQYAHQCASEKGDAWPLAIPNIRHMHMHMHMTSKTGPSFTLILIILRSTGFSNNGFWSHNKFDWKLSYWWYQRRLVWFVKPEDRVMKSIPGVSINLSSDHYYLRQVL